MKILRIRIVNLNSLKGEHRLDLTGEPLASAGLFAITGPTGAGKTTLLDAVTLALYGRAARYGNESNPENVMTRHCGECSAEVEFAVPSGVYRAVWQRRRARKKADGQLQPPKRYIYDAEGEPLAEQIREAEEKIEELLGLNYDRFLRSVLLAQGDFARFLKAKADERAELLESLTGTVIYSRLGKLAHEETGRKEAELQAKETELDQLDTLDKEAREELESAVQQGEERIESLTKEIAAGRDMLHRIRALEGLRKQERHALEEQATVERDRKSASGDLENLRKHRLTVPFSADLARLEGAESTVKSATQSRERAEKAHAAAVQDLAQSNHVLRAATEAALAHCRERAKSAGKTAEKEAKTASEARAWLDEHREDAALADQVGDVVAAIGDLKTSRTTLGTSWASWREDAAGILPGKAGELPEQLDSTEEPELEAVLAEFLGEADKQSKAKEAEGREARKQHDLRQDHLGKAKLVAKLSDHRHELKPGEACPLCGALEHPYAEGSAPGSEISELEAEVEKARKKLEDARDDFRAFSRTLQTLKEKRDGLLDALRDALSCHEKLGGLLQPLGARVPAPGGENALRTALQERERAYRQHAKAEEDAGKRHQDAERAAKEAAREAEALEKKVAALPSVPPEAEVESVASGDLPSVTEAEESYADARTRERTTATQSADRKKDEKKAVRALQEVKAPLERAVGDSEFGTLDRLRAAKLGADEASRIEELDARLKQRATAAEALLKQARSGIGELLQEKVLEGEEAAAFKERQDKLADDKEKLLADQAKRRTRLEADDEKKKLRKDKEAELREDRGKLVVWRRLRDLIGSYDGSKFRRYAQAISLDILVRHANRHLESLSDRYRICRDEEETLNLQIEDLDQASVKRPMASLSGGESFLVSLALALGLSDLAGRTVRIDSLFIDEGFGSLDGETLEVAISALESLRQDHKSVGVISHVALLKERIATQIIVEKQAGGTSRIRVVPAAP